ncbi:MAG: ribosomal protein S18-alanine N-acetyltransferase [Mariprofundaceae bacterium]|nr:ribosomal protein S18-alanine N-acetyltransferase [Mariprofundaceae bacterium]
MPPLMAYRLGSVDDIDAVYALNIQLFAENWSKKSLLDVMRSGFNLHVCEISEQLVGYILSQDIFDEVHIMQVGVDPSCQRQGIAKKLSQDLLADKHDYALALLEVRASNIAAQNLYAQLGFNEVARRKSYYVPENKGESREDAILMTLDIMNKVRSCEISKPRYE